MTGRHLSSEPRQYQHLPYKMAVNTTPMVLNIREFRGVTAIDLSVLLSSNWQRRERGS